MYVPRQAAEQARKGRGTVWAIEHRFSAEGRSDFDDGWGTLEQAALAEDSGPVTQVLEENVRGILSGNDSPDIGFDLSINPYRGCEHGCVYCYARPTHSYLSLSPGLDFETRIVAKVNAAERLREALAARGYAPGQLNIGSVTDAYQPAERRLRITRALIEVLAEARHPFSIITKSCLVERDIDLIAPMAAEGLARVYVSITTLDRALARKLEPRAAAPERRLETLRRLTQAGIPTGVMTAPVIPALNDHEMERILELAAQAGARHAGYVLLRLPLELTELFENWLQAHAPLKAEHVMSLLRQSRGGKEYDAAFHTRMKGQGIFAETIAARFRLACRRLSLNLGHDDLDCSKFRPPAGAAPSTGSTQMTLF